MKHLASLALGAILVGAAHAGSLGMKLINSSVSSSKSGKAQMETTPKADANSAIAHVGLNGKVSATGPGTDYDTSTVQLTLTINVKAYWYGADTPPTSIQVTTTNSGSDATIASLYRNGSSTPNPDSNVTASATGGPAQQAKSTAGAVPSTGSDGHSKLKSSVSLVSVTWHLVSPGYYESDQTFSYSATAQANATMTVKPYYGTFDQTNALCSGGGVTSIYYGLPPH